MTTAGAGGPDGLFYDIDGCLHPHGTARLTDDGKIRRSADDGLFVWAHLLTPILDEFPRLPLICHSSWRDLYTFEELRRQLPSPLAERTVAMTAPLRDRHEAIKEFASALGIVRHVILDDDPWAFPRNTPELIVVPSHMGLSEPGAIERLRAALLCASGRHE